MGAKEKNIAVDEHWFKGENRTFRYPCVDGADPPVALDISAFGLIWELKTSLEATTAILSRSTAASEITFDTNGTRALVAITGAITLAIDARPYVHLLRRIDSGQVMVLGFGNATLQDAGTIT